MSSKERVRLADMPRVSPLDSILGRDEYDEERLIGSGQTRREWELQTRLSMADTKIIQLEEHVKRVQEEKDRLLTLVETLVANLLKK